jgi:MipA family protein
MNKKIAEFSLGLLAALGVAGPVMAQTQAQKQMQTLPTLVGDVGMAVYRTPQIAASTEKPTTVLPYVYADYGALYARVDTFGYKLTPMGAGHLELVTRLSFEGYQPTNSAIGKRERPKPIGVGTFQETPYGGFFAYAFHDASSGGSLLDASYAAELQFGGLHVYPQLGFERRDRKYVEALYGVSAAESARSGLTAYAANNSITPNAAVALEYPLFDSLKLTFQVRKKWLDKSINDSPLVNSKQQTSSFLAISQTFK